MPFIINEEEALKSMLKGLTVSDAGNSARPVGVFFGQPAKEIRSQTYPYITIELVGINEDTSRAHRGYVATTYIPDGAVAPIGSLTDFPIPVDLLYQVTTWSRQPRHDRQILNLLFNLGLLPFRFGQLFITEDGTNRRLDVLGFSKADTTESDKPLFRNVFNIRISSELFPDQLVQLTPVTQAPVISYTQQNSIFTVSTLP